jgi:hypothetical protein
MAQRSAGIGLDSLVQPTSMAKPTSVGKPVSTPQPASTRKKISVANPKPSSQQPTPNPARSWRVVVGDGSLKELFESQESIDVIVDGPENGPEGEDSSALDAIGDTSSRFRDIDRQLGQVVAAWPHLSPVIRAAVMTMIHRALG